MKILVVEDEKKIASFIKRGLEEEIARVGKWIQAMILRLQFERTEAVLLAAAVDFGAKFTLRQERVEASRASQTIGMLAHGQTDQLDTDRQTEETAQHNAAQGQPVDYRPPIGLTVWPQPGRYSLGHTGNLR